MKKLRANIDVLDASLLMLGKRMKRLMKLVWLKKEANVAVLQQTLE
jgi:hypothetical protein